mmetsp:Transcript_20050/g.60439  ORF Transcript_20050/g.60439 Transcript_20050/m.60439 type:complete len:263 (-) Transcript_20050:906-1694(-)
MAASSLARLSNWARRRLDITAKLARPPGEPGSKRSACSTALNVISKRGGRDDVGCSRSRQLPAPHLLAMRPRSFRRNQPFGRTPSCAQAQDVPCAAQCSPSSSSAAGRTSPASATAKASRCSSEGTHSMPGPQLALSWSGFVGAVGGAWHFWYVQYSAECLPRRTSKHLASSCPPQTMHLCTSLLVHEAGASSSGGASPTARSTVRRRISARPGKPTVEAPATSSPAPAVPQSALSSCRRNRATCKSGARSLAPTNWSPPMS